MLWFLVVTALLGVQLQTAEGGKVTVTGGGVVKPETDAVLSYAVGQVWDRCYWYHYKDDSQEKPYCLFGMNFDTGVGSKIRCSDEIFGKNIEYTGKDKTKCEITVKAANQADNGTWAVKVDEDFQTTKTSLTIASDMKNVTLAASEMVVGGAGDVYCTVVGGRPGPKISVNLGFVESPNQTIDDTEDDNKVLTTVFEATVIPKVEDHGKQIECSAKVTDNEDKVLYGPTKAEPLTLDVKFAPQPIGEFNATDRVEQDLLVVIEFMSNPKPDELRWIISSSDQAAPLVNISFNESKGRFTASDIKEVADKPTHFKAELTIKKLTLEDGNNEYEMEASNPYGNTKYPFKVHVLKKDETSNGGTSPGVIAAVVVIVVAIVLIILGIVIYKKVTKHRQETAPLRS